MRYQRFFLLVIITLLMVSPAAASDISGTWKFKVNSPEGDHPAKLTVTQDGEKISGLFASHRGEYKVEGTLKGDRIQFTVRYTGGDAPPAIPFQGKLEGDKMSGQWQAGETTGSWSAEKDK